MVYARELSLKIRNPGPHSEDMEIESFIHGAMWRISYSGALPAQQLFPGAGTRQAGGLHPPLPLEIRGGGGRSRASICQFTEMNGAPSSSTQGIYA